jgi:hypothetical protein
LNTSEKHLQDLSRLMKETGGELTEGYYSQFSQILENLGLFSEFAGTGPVPLEVWTGIAQALAETYRSVGKREIAKVTPTLFVKEG